jgi:hypothetical protein
MSNLAPVVIPVVILVVPVAFMEAPAITIMVPVRMAPIGAFKRSPFPVSRNPAIVTTVRGPVTLDPIIAWAWSYRTHFIPSRRRAYPDREPNLCGGRKRDRRGEHCTQYPI